MQEQNEVIDFSEVSPFSSFEPKDPVSPISWNSDLEDIPEVEDEESENARVYRIIQKQIHIVFATGPQELEYIIYATNSAIDAGLVRAAVLNDLRDGFRCDIITLDSELPSTTSSDDLAMTLSGNINDETGKVNIEHCTVEWFFETMKDIWEELQYKNLLGHKYAVYSFIAEEDQRKAFLRKNLKNIRLIEMDFDYETFDNIGINVVCQNGRKTLEKIKAIFGY